MYKDYTVQTLLDKLDLIECFEHPGHDLRLGEVLSKLRQLNDSLGVDPSA